MMVKIKFVTAAIFCMLVAAVWAEDAKPLASLANGEVVSDQDLSDYLDRRMDLRQNARHSIGVEAAVQEMAMTRVLTLEGERLGIPRNAEKGELKRFDDVYGLAVYKKQSPICNEPGNEQEARQYYDAHPQAFMLPPQARVERIILPAETQIGGSSAMAWLQDQARAVAQGKRQFQVVALRAQGEYSLDAQGDLGWLSLTSDHIIMRALQTVKAGELMGPVQDGEFVYLFSVKQRREARQLSWNESKTFVAARAVSYCREQAQTKMREELFQRYGVHVDQAAIRQLVAKGNSAAGVAADEKAGAQGDAKPQ